MRQRYENRKGREKREMVAVKHGNKNNVFGKR